MTGQTPPVDRPAPDPATWRGAGALIASDLRRLAQHLGGGGLGHRVYWALLPTFQALAWYRVARCLYLKGWRLPARLMFLLSLYLFRSELPPTASIGGACLIAHVGASFYGTAGARLTLMGTCGVGPWGDKRDVGAGVGYPLLGDDVVLGQLCAVLGPVRIGDGAHIGPGTIVMRDVPAQAVVMSPRPRILRRAEAPEATQAGDEEVS